MTAEADLIAAIVAVPTDDRPRMVYADWLMQRGDPRGELIALQCTLAQSDADAPEPAVHARERVLREVHYERWTAPLHAIAPATYQLRRGFVEHASAHLAFPLDDERAARLFAAAPLLRSIAIRGMDLVEPPPAAWGRFEAITLREACYLTTEQLQAFASSPHLGQLRRFHAVNLAADKAGAAALLAIPTPLEHFGLALYRESTRGSGGGHAEVVLEHLASTSWPLRSIYLGGFDVKDVSGLSRFALVELGLHDCRTRKLPVLPELVTLELDEPAGKIDLGELVGSFPALRRLRIRCAKLTDAHVHALLASPHASRLRRLDLSRNSISDQGVRLLAAMPELCWLHVEGNPIDNETKQLVRNRNRPVVDPPPDHYPADVLNALLQDHKIPAIKEHRALTGAGLLESKLAVERFAAELDTPWVLPPTTSWLG